MAKKKSTKRKVYPNKKSADAAVKRKGKGAYKYKVKGGYSVGQRKK